MLPRAILAAFTIAVICTGCKGHYFPPPIPVISSPAPLPTPGIVNLTPASLSFGAVGAGFAKSVSAAQAYYSGSFTAGTTTCAGIATIASAGSASFTVTPVAIGHCTFSITGGGGVTGTLTIDVTTTTVGGS